MEEVQGMQQEAVESDKGSLSEMNGEETAESLETMDMEQMMEAYEAQEVHRGKKLEGTVVGSSEDGWLIDVGYKCEGFLPRREWTHRVLVEDVDEPRKGMSLKFRW